MLLSLATCVAAATACNDFEDRRAPSAGSGGGIEDGGSFNSVAGRTNHSDDTSDGGNRGAAEGGSAVVMGGVDTSGAGGASGADGCDYVEHDDTTSTTEFSYVEEQTSDGVLTICGTLEGDGTYLDYDHFQFPITEAGSYAISLVLSEPLEPYAVALTSYGPYRRTTTGNGGNLAWFFVEVNVSGMTTAILQFDSDRYLPDLLNKRIDYTLRIQKKRPPPCEPVSSDQAAYFYAEANDGPEHKGNDVIWRPDYVPQFVDYPSAAESTGIVVREGERSAISGQSALVPLPPEDIDQDRDTFLIRTGEVNRLSMWLETSLPHNLDVVVFERDQLWVTSDGLWFQEGHAMVLPNREYWIWISGRAIDDGGGEPYSLTICGEAFEP